MQAATFHFLLSKDNCHRLCLRANILDNLPLTLTALSKLRFLSVPVPNPSSELNTNAEIWCNSSKAWGGYTMGVGCLSKTVIHYLISWSESLPLCTQGSTGELWQQNILLTRLLQSLIAQHKVIKQLHLQNIHSTLQKRAPNYRGKEHNSPVPPSPPILVDLLLPGAVLFQVTLHSTTRNFPVDFFLHSVNSFRRAESRCLHRGDRGGKPAQLGNV